MKKLYLVILLLLPTLAFSQTKGDNIILIKTTLSDQEAYSAIGNKLLDLNINFKGDKEFYTIKADPIKITNRPSFKLANLVIVKQGTVKISGKIMVIGDETEFPAEFRNSGITVHRDGFKELQQFATQLKPAIGDGEMTYTKQ